MASRSTLSRLANRKRLQRLDFQVLLPVMNPGGCMSAVRSRVLWSGLVVAAGIVLGACGSSEPTGNNGFTATNIAIAGGNGQVGAPGSTLPTPLAVKVTNDINGQAQTAVTLGSTAGTVVVNAAVNGTQLIATFVLTAGGSSANSACS